jgi:hypothetical protein
MFRSGTYQGGLKKPYLWQPTLSGLFFDGAVYRCKSGAYGQFLWRLWGTDVFGHPAHGRGARNDAEQARLRIRSLIGQLRDGRRGCS